MSGTQSHLIIISNTIPLCSRDIYSCLLIIIGEFFPFILGEVCLSRLCNYSLLYFLLYDIVCVVFVLIVITCIIVIIAF